jgi:hypothetical protein
MRVEDDAVSLFSFCTLSRASSMAVKWLITGEEDKNLSNVERELTDCFRKLDSRDQGDILGNVKHKLENVKKGDITSNLENA